MNNQLKTILLLGALSGLLLGIGALVGRNTMPLFLLLALAVSFVSYFWSDKIVLKVSGARPISEAEAPRLHAVVHELALSAGIPKPGVFIIPEMQPNAFATGRDPDHGAVAVTQGILQLLSERELRGVLAHELGHIRNRDILVSSVAAMLATTITYVAHSLRWFGIFGGSGRRDEVSPASALVLAIVAPIAAMMIQLGISRSREYLADDSGAQLSGDPEALASALEKLDHAAHAIPADVEPATASMYIVNPFTGSGGGMWSGLFSTHPPMSKRIARLRGMSNAPPAV